jgi:tetratricopeptide (TPR) repeat protein
MTDIFEIQCKSCGSLYLSEEAACPYCGQPQPEFISDADEPYDQDYLPEDVFYPNQAEQLTYADDETALPYQAALEQYEADYHGQPDYDTYEEDYAPAELYPAHQEFDPYYPPQAERSYPLKADDQELTGFDQEAEPAAEARPRRFTWRHTLLGCGGTLLCIVLFYGGIGLFAAYQGLQEQTSAKQAEAIEHYQRGQQHLANNSLDLAIAEFELAVSLNPILLEAREALREAKRIAQALPTPTSQTRSDAAVEILKEAEELIAGQSWAEAVQSLLQVRDLDADYQTEQVSDLLYQANYELGRQLITPDQVEQAVQAFDMALAERPDDPTTSVQRAKAALYLEGQTAETTDPQKAVKAYEQLYRDDANYLDVTDRLAQAYEALGDELAQQEDWCQAEAQYLEALRVADRNGLQAKADSSDERCQAATVAQAGAGATPSATPNAPTLGPGSSAAITYTTVLSKPTPAASQPPAAGGSLYYSAFNPNENRWEILAVSAGGGAPRVVTINGTMPAVSPDGRWLVYHSELLDSEGFHRLDLTSGEDARITLLRRDILPRWGPDSSRFVFVAQEPGTGRWQVYLGYADGKSSPTIVRDGRTPDWSPQGDLLAYQGTDPAGNNPGIYLVPFGGGESTRLTNHESDRSPDFSPNGSQVAYMSTKGGNWDIYTISTEGSAPRQITTSPGQDGLPVWSPDGSQIAYVSDAGGSWDIYVISAAGGTPRQVAAWDGTKLADWLMAQIWWAR